MEPSGRWPRAARWTQAEFLRTRAEVEDLVAPTTAVMREPSPDPSYGTGSCVPRGVDGLQRLIRAAVRREPSTRPYHWTARRP
ncbi:hypothetical protein GCM10010199_25930 [Dactylosporangium roseum]